MGMSIMRGASLWALSGGLLLAAAWPTGLRAGTRAGPAAEEARAESITYDQAMGAGERRLAWPGGSRHTRPPVDFAAAAEAFGLAVEQARDEHEEAAARLARASSLLQDLRVTGMELIRADYERVTGMEEAGAGQRLQALLGLGETYLRELRYEEAHACFERAVHHAQRPREAAEAWYARARALAQERRYAEARKALEDVLAMERVDPDRGMGWEARALLEGMRLAPLVRRDRPRLFFNAESWPRVAARAQGARQDLFYQWHAEILVGTVPAVSDFRDHQWTETMRTAFVARMTGDPDLAVKARDMLRVTLDWLLSRAQIRMRCYPGIAAAAALDWVWDDLDPAERDALGRDLLHYVYAMLVEDRLQGRSQNSPAYMQQSAAWYAGLALLEDDLDDVTYYRLLVLLGSGQLHHIQRKVDGYIRSGGSDGAVRTALEYYFGASPLDLFWSFLHCRESALNKKTPPEWIMMLSPDYILRNALGFTEDGMLHLGYGNSWRRHGGMRAWGLAGHLSQMIHFFSASQPEQIAVAVYLRERMQAKGFTASGVYPVYPFILDLEHAPPGEIPPGMPLARHFEHVGQILMSSGFGPQETYALFSCGGNQDQAHYDSTHFTIFRQGFLAIDSGTRAQSQLWPGAPPEAREQILSGLNYEQQTVAHNAVLILMEGETFPRDALNTGGQNRMPAAARLLAFESGRHFAYMATDATPVYHEDKCALMVRQVLYLPPDHLVIFDRVTSTRADYPKTWLLQTANEPQISGREFRADQDRGRIFCRTVYPRDAELTAVGGPGQEFWAGGRNWPIPEASTYYNSIGMEPGGEVPENMGRWRVEVTPGAPREEDVFLHLIQTSDRTVETMVASSLETVAEGLMLSFSSGTRTVEVLFHKQGEVGGHLVLHEKGRVLVDRAFTRTVMPQYGLALMEQDLEPAESRARPEDP